MATRILLSNGRYCYSGPNCRLHSTQGVNKAKADIVKTVQDYLYKNVSLEDLTKQAQAKAKAELVYDATLEGQQELEHQLSSLTPGTEEHSRIDYRLTRAKIYEETLEEEAKNSSDDAEQKTGLVDTLDMNKVTTNKFDEEYNQTVSDGYLGAPHVKGTKVISQDYSLKETISSIRADFAKEKKNGNLPSNVKYSVRKDSPQHITITIQGLSDKGQFKKTDLSSESSVDLTPEAKQLKARVDKIVTSYKEDSSNPGVDYFNANFYSTVVIENEQSRKFRLKEQETAKARAIANVQQKDFVKNYGLKPEETLKRVIWMKDTGVNTFGEIPGTKLIVVKNKMSDTLRIINMGGKSVIGEKTLLDVVADHWCISKILHKRSTLLK